LIKQAFFDVAKTLIIYLLLHEKKVDFMALKDGIKIIIQTSKK